MLNSVRIKPGYFSGFLSADWIQPDGFVRVLLAHGWFSFASRFGQKLAGLAILKALRSWFVRFATDHHHFTSAFNSHEKILKLRLVSETDLALVTITAAFPLTFIAHFLICDYFRQSAKLQTLSAWAIYSRKHGNNWQFCEAMICSSTSMWRLVDWSDGKASPLGMLLSCPKVGNSSPHHFSDNSQWWKLWIGSAVWCDNWRCLILTVLRLRPAYFHCKSVSFAVLSCLSF